MTQTKFDKELCMYKDVCCSFDTEDCNSICGRYIITNFLLTNSQLPKKDWKRKKFKEIIADREAHHELVLIRKNIVEFVKQGRNLYITSENSKNGKTSWAISLMQKYFDEIWQTNGFKVSGLFINIPIFLMQVKDGMNNYNPELEKIKQLIRSVDLVIWDDIATARLSQYDRNLLFAYVKERINNGKSNIYTGTLNTDQLYEYLGGLLAICIEYSDVVTTFKAREWVQDDFITDNK